MPQVQSIQTSPAPYQIAAGDGPPLRDAFIAAMGLAVTGVNLVTTDGPCGRFGVTVSAVSSVSADPPLLLACVNSRSPSAAAIAGNASFCINILGADQRHIADTFAGRPPEGFKPFDFASADWDDPADHRWHLRGAIATFDCVLEHSVQAGSHLVFMGRVVRASPTDLTQPLPALAYSRRAYGAARPINEDFLKGPTQ